MYEKNKLNRITLRLNPDQFDYVKANADILGVSPSEFLRMVINTSMSMSSKLDVSVNLRGVQGRENDKANINNIV